MHGQEAGATAHNPASIMAKTVASLAVVSAAISCVAPALAGETITYTYDAKGRVVQVARAGSVNNGVTTNYVHDKVDNRTNKAISIPQSALTINDVTAAEGSNAVFTVTLSPSAAGTVTVNYATADGTATAGSDYTANSGLLTFTTGQTSKTISIAALSDAVSESNETFQVNLSNASGATIADSQGIGTITNVTSNHNPVAVNDNYSFTTATLPKTYTLSPLSNDSDPDGDPLTITAASISSGDGSVTIINNNTQLNLTAYSDGLFVISYTISDGHGGSATGQINVSVTCTKCL